MNRGQCARVRTCIRGPLTVPVRGFGILDTGLCKSNHIKSPGVNKVFCDPGLVFTEKSVSVAPSTAVLAEISSVPSASPDASLPLLGNSPVWSEYAPILLIPSPSQPAQIGPEWSCSPDIALLSIDWAWPLWLSGAPGINWLFLVDDFTLPYQHPSL